ncbi:MAG: TolC family protein [Candidatus Solibacter usitatus]|nr:TolC family protein [Candidatus Solibacter usitatus]
MAERSHPQLQASNAQVDVARAGITTARAYPNPEAGFMAGRQIARLPSAVAGLDIFYTFSQPLELGQLRPSRVKVAELGLESSRHFLAGTRLAVLGAVRRAFHEVLRRKSEIALARENLRPVEDLLPWRRTWNSRKRHRLPASCHRSINCGWRRCSGIHSLP